ncbi:MAG: riboflavin biosynthesis protein RibF [Gammaproteobacteria bacterium]|jgi:riboflavin kinase/FMN adenylyltransferase|nr:riboflavin biosynthesis protein RibF [Gammaproteobacteria bacterium]
MKIFHVEPFITQPLPSIAAIGNFDGMHRGHQFILQELKAKARELGLASTVILFEPQPQEFFNPKNAPARLQSFRDKLAILQQFGIDQVICLRFNQVLADLPPENFLQLLKNHYHIEALMPGRDFCFGKNRAGNVAFLKAAGEKIFEIPDVQESQQRVSSTRIRECLQTGDFLQAAKLLGHPYSISGKVGHGAKRGRLLDFPTANIALTRKRSPVHGVYVVAVQLPSGEKMYGVANVGVRPTVATEAAWFLEVFLFTHQNDLNLYAQRIQVTFLHKLRDEKRFDSLDALKFQIQKDVDEALEYCATLSAS